MPESAAARVIRLLRQAEAVQWDAAPIPKPRDSNDGGKASGHGDPTADTALDPRRLEVRDAVEYARRSLPKPDADLGEIEVRLARALDRWEGKNE